MCERSHLYGKRLFDYGETRDTVCHHGASRMNEQEMVDHFAALAKPRLSELLRLKAEHVYDPTPGDAESTFPAGTSPIRLKLKTTVEPYVAIERFVTEEKQMGFVINPGLVPIVKAIALEVRGRRLLVTRRIAERHGDRGVIAHVDGYGVRILMHTDAEHKDTYVTWECLYGVG